ncbi:MAG: CDP-alcohol phosphatidyltransferase family protein, partial [Candidatus Aenigmarchaeota archaeon]|nr:CDP-alcohol phosphatidyltransferase family protein [Candidatus Aenigmarchaeota archaeon]
MLYKNRQKFNSLSIKVGMIFCKIPLSPNQWTILSLIPAVLGLLATYYGNISAAIILFAITPFIDIIDGSVARVMGRVTKLGAYLDTVIDRYIEAIMIVSVMLLGLPDFYLPIQFWIIALLFGSLMSTYAKAASAEKKIVQEIEGHGIKGGILEHTDRVILLFVIFLLSLFVGKIYLTYIVIAMAILT